MDETGVNWIAILVAGVASFAFGAVYYMALSKPWMAAVGTTRDEIKARQNAMVFIVAFVAQLVMAYTLARVMACVEKCERCCDGDVGLRDRMRDSTGC